MVQQITLSNMSKYNYPIKFWLFSALVEGGLLHIFLRSLSEGFSRYLQLFNYPLVLRIEVRQHASVVSSDLSLLTLLSVVLEGVLQLVTSLLGVLGNVEYTRVHPAERGAGGGTPASHLTARSPR